MNTQTKKRKSIQPKTKSKRTQKYERVAMSKSNTHKKNIQSDTNETKKLKRICFETLIN